MKCLTVTLIIIYNSNKKDRVRLYFQIHAPRREFKTRHRVFLMKFEIFEIVDKHDLECLIYIVRSQSSQN